MLASGDGEKIMDIDCYSCPLSLPGLQCYVRLLSVLFLFPPVLTYYQVMYSVC